MPRIPAHARAPRAYPVADAATIPRRRARSARPRAMLDRFAADRRNNTTAATTIPEAMAIHKTRRSCAMPARIAPKASGARAKRTERSRVTPGNMRGLGNSDYGVGSTIPTAAAPPVSTCSRMIIGCPSLQTAMRTASPLFSRRHPNSVPSGDGCRACATSSV